MGREDARRGDARRDGTRRDGTRRDGTRRDGADAGAPASVDGVSSADGVAGTGTATSRPERPPRPLIIACVILGLEALALVGLAAFLVVDTLAGAAHSLGGALLAALFVLICAAALVLGARGLLRLSPAARTPIVVLQVLAIPVSYSLGFQAGRVGVGGPMLVAAIAVLYLLFTPPSRAALDRDI